MPRLCRLLFAQLVEQGGFVHCGCLGSNLETDPHPCFASWLANSIPIWWQLDGRIETMRLTLYMLSQYFGDASQDD